MISLRRLTLLLGLSITVAMLALYAWSPPPVQAGRDAVRDGFQRLFPRDYDPGLPVHVVDIDEASLEAFGQWPWPRSYLAELTHRLWDHGAVAIGFDVLFAEPDRTSPAQIREAWTRFQPEAAPAPPDLSDRPDHDALFARALARGPAVLALSGFTEGGAPAAMAGISHTGAAPLAALQGFAGHVGNIAALTEAAAGLGVISLGRSRDGVVRDVPLVTVIDGQMVPALSAEVLRVAQGDGSYVLRTTQASGEASGGTTRPLALRIGAAEVPLTGRGRFMVHFAGAQPARVTPARDILLATPDDAAIRDRLAGRIVLVGSSAQGLFDIRTTPLDDAVAGVTLHAEILEQVLSEHYLRRPDWMPGLEALLIVVLGATLSGLLAWQKPVAGLAVMLAGVAAPLAAGAWAFATQATLFDPLVPALTALAVYLPSTTLGFVAKDRDRRAIRGQFAHFVPEPVIEAIARNPASLTPGGADRELTIMFIDMRGFSTVTEGMAPGAVVAMVNDYLSAASRAILAHGGTIDKFIGDAVMAFWNAPVAVPGHPGRATEAAFAVRDAVAVLSWPVKISVGINTGPVSVGMMGSRQRLGYTCIGDAVNLAARIEGLTRGYGAWLCAGAATAARLPEAFVTIAVDRVAVKGRAAPEDVFVVVRRTPATVDLAAAIAAARAAYLSRDWDRAAALWAALPEVAADDFAPGAVARLYLERIAVLRATQPGPGWDGTFVATEKRMGAF